jgi:hypothetical protein
MYMMDIAKSVNVSKRIKKKSEEFAAGFVTENNSKKLIEQSQFENHQQTSNNNEFGNNKKLKSILKLGSKSTNQIIDLNEAIRNDLVILPDSLFLTQKVKYVIDLKTGKRLDFDHACQCGIVDVFNRIYLDTRSNEKMSLFEALGKYYIVMKDDESDDKAPNIYPKEVNVESVHKTTLNQSKKKLGENDIVTLFNPHTGEQIGMNEAKQIGVYNPKTNQYIDTYKNRAMSLEDAVDKGK